MTIDYNALATALIGQMGQGVKTKAATGTPNFVFGHGPGGVFSYPGLSRPVFSAMALPVSGLQSRLPVLMSRDSDPMYGLVTGVTATTGSEPSAVCANAPVAGLTKLCTHSFVFSRRARRTREVDVTRVGMVRNRADFTDLQLMGGSFGRNGTASVVPTGINDGGTLNPLNSEINKAMFELAVAWSRDFARELYTASPSNNSGDGTKYFYGLDTLINTGYRDSVTGVACPAADSQIVSALNYPVRDNGAFYVARITAIYNQLFQIAAQAQLLPVKWALVMPYQLFYELTEVWPCAYSSFRCAPQTGTTIYSNSDDYLRMRDEMRGDMENFQGQYLLINGQKVDVILDDAVTETSIGSGVFQSQIYFVPLTVLGGTPVTYMEYFDMTEGANYAAMAAPNAMIKTSDGGRFMWVAEWVNTCLAFQVTMQNRILLLTPHLAARLHSIRYSPTLSLRSPFTDSSYFYNGGNSAGLVGINIPPFYSPVA